jgi:predicted nucleic acid-binding protein
MSLKLYLDCCALQRPFDDRSQLRVATEAEAILKLFEEFEAGFFEIASSDVLLFELSKIELSARRTYCINLLAKSSYFVELTDSIEALAISYSELDIKTADALHLASAVKGNADYFCSCDDRFIKKAQLVETGLTKVVSVLELVQELEP